MKGKPSVFGFHLEPLRVLPVRPTLMFQLIFKQEGCFSLFNQALIFEVCQLYKTFSLMYYYIIKYESQSCSNMQIPAIQY